MRLRLLSLGLILLVISKAQVGVPGGSGFISVGSLPGTCAAGKAYFLTSTNKYYGCGPVNTLAQFSASSGVTSVLGTSNQITVVTSVGTATISLPAVVVFPGTVTLQAGTTSISSINMPSGVAKTSPVAGDFWNLSGVVQFYDGSTTQSLMYRSTVLSSAQMPTFTGNVTNSGLAMTIGAGQVTNAMLAGSIAASNLIGTDIATLGTVTTGTWHGTAIANTYLANSATTVNGQTCTLGSTCTVTVSITSGVSGLGANVATFLGTPSGANLAAALTTGIPNSALANPATTVDGQTCTLGSTCTTTFASQSDAIASAHVMGTTSGKAPVASTAADMSAINYATGGGSANTQTATYAPAIAALTTGTFVCWLPTAANTTTTPTFSPNSLTAKTITKVGGAALASSDLTTTAVACAVYDGTYWELQNPQTTGSGVTSVTGTAPVTSSGGATPAISCTTCTTSSAALTSNAVVIGGGLQAESTISTDTTTTHALFATAGAPAFRAIATGDIPTLNQNTTGTAATITGLLVSANIAKQDIMDSASFCAAAGASGTAYTCSLSPVVTAYVTGTHYRFKADVANTGTTPTINLNSVGAKTIVKATGGITTALAVNDLRAGQWVDLVYDGTNMQMQSTLGNASGGGSFAGSTGVINASNGSGSGQTTSCTDNGTNMTCTEPMKGPSFTGTGSDPLIGLPSNTSISDAIVSGTYTSGGTISGSSTQTCTVTFAATSGTTATATVALTGSNTIAGGTALTMTNNGTGYTSAPTTATFSNGTATCSGSPTLATVTGAAVGDLWNNAGVLTFDPTTVNTPVAIVQAGTAPVLTGTNFTGVPNAALSNSAITIGGTSVSLGGSTSSLPSPGAIGGTTPASATFTQVKINGSSTGGDTFTSNLSGSSSYTITTPTHSANDTLCLQTAANCSSGGGSTVSPNFMYLWGEPGYNAGASVAMVVAGAHTGNRYAYTLTSATTLSYIYADVTTADSGKYGSFAIYNSAMTTVECQTTPFSLTSTGIVRAAWTCTSLPAGAYYVAVTEDGTGASIGAYFSGYNLELYNASGAINGYANTSTCLSSGTGVSMVFTASPSCSWVQITNPFPVLAVGN